MISRPIVAAPLAGALLGDPSCGVWAGGFLEILSLRQLPIGASRGWDTGPAAVAAAAAAASAGGPAALLIGVTYGVLVGWLGSWTVHGLRHLNVRLVGREGAVSTPGRLTSRHLAALGLDFLRAALLTLAVVAFFAWAVRLGDDPGPRTGGGPLAGWVLLAVGSLALAVSLRAMARGRRVWIAFGAGTGLGALMGLWLF